MTDELKSLRKKFPFLTYITYENQDVVGIVQNINTHFVMIYDYNLIRGLEMRKEFLEAGEKWWFESNTDIPIDVFIGRRFDKFAHALRGYTKRNVEIIDGPVINLEEVFSKRVKKKRVELVADIE